MIDRLAQKLSMYVHLSDADQRALTDAMGPVQNFPARADIGDIGGDLDALTVIVEGWACRSRHLAGGRHHIVSLVLPGDPYDPHAFLAPSIDHPISALTPVSCVTIPGPTLKRLTGSRPTLRYAFQREALATVALQREWTVSLGCRSGIERLAHLFCELHVRLGAVGLAQANTYSLPLTQHHLAHALGQTSVHLNRMVQELRANELIMLRGRRLTIYNPERLAALAHFDPAYLQFTNWLPAF